MKKTKYLILGAGPAGLTFANKLLQSGINDFLVIEKEAVAGGLCRSEMVDGAPLDIGGGHFLDVRRPMVNEFLFNFMPEDEWTMFKRDSRISVLGYEIAHPFEANIWQFPDYLQQEYLDSISKAGCVVGAPMPDSFVDWIYWKLGDRIANDYMIPYNKKIFSSNLNDLGTYWLDKLPDVSYEETLISCQNNKPYGKQPGHAEFYYPKEYGYGELWRRMGDALGDRLIYGESVISLDIKNRQVTTPTMQVQADIIVTTIPWTSIRRIVGFSKQALSAVSRLKHSGVDIRYFSDNLDTDAQWIYYPDESLAYHRILVRHNFCTGNRGYWTETNVDRMNAIESSAYHYVNEYAYPLNTTDKPEAMALITKEAVASNVFPLGRWGEHCHYNSDATVERAMNLFDDIVKKAG